MATSAFMFLWMGAALFDRGDGRATFILSPHVTRALDEVNSSTSVINDAGWDDVGAARLESKHISEALTRSVEQRLAVHVELVGFCAVWSSHIFLFVLVAAEAILVRTAIRLRLLLDDVVWGHQLVSRTQRMELLKVKDWRLGRQEIFTHILLMITTLSFLLVDLINEPLDAIRLARAECGHSTVA